MPHKNDQDLLAKTLLGSTGQARPTQQGRTLAHELADHLRIALAAEINNGFRERAVMPGEVLPVAMAAQMSAAADLAAEIAMGFIQIIDVEAKVDVSKMNEARSSGMSPEDFDAYCQTKLRDQIAKAASTMPGLSLLTRGPLENSVVGRHYRAAIAILPPFHKGTITTKPLPMPGQMHKLGGDNG